MSFSVTDVNPTDITRWFRTPELILKFSFQVGDVGFIRPCHWTGDSDLGGYVRGGYVLSLLDTYTHTSGHFTVDSMQSINYRTDDQTCNYVNHSRRRLFLALGAYGRTQLCPGRTPLVGVRGLRILHEKVGWSGTRDKVPLKLKASAQICHHICRTVCRDVVMRCSLELDFSSCELIA